MVIERFIYEGFACLILKIPGMGHLCGYVGIVPGHKLYGKGYEELDYEVHGGLTFAGKLPEESEWWLGFDCAHYGDLVPGIMDGVYRDKNFVRQELKQLVDQIKDDSTRT